METREEAQRSGEVGCPEPVEEGRDEGGSYVYVLYDDLRFGNCMQSYSISVANIGPLCSQLGTGTMYELERNEK
jgi:hypothetical protein